MPEQGSKETEKLPPVPAIAYEPLEEEDDDEEFVRTFVDNLNRNVLGEQGLVEATVFVRTGLPLGRASESDDAESIVPLGD